MSKVYSNDNTTRHMAKTFSLGEGINNSGSLYYFLKCLPMKNLQGIRSPKYISKHNQIKYKVNIY